MKLLFGVFLVILAAGCISNSGSDMMDQETSAQDEFSSNGETIYHTGSNMEGGQIATSGGPSWLSMHGGSCTDCHGADGKGGITPMMCDKKTPPITYLDLTEREHEGGHTPYTDETIKKAITGGIGPDGEELDPCMPKWEMSDKDMDDVIGYLKTLSPTEEGH